MSLVSILAQLVPDLAKKHVYELSSSGPLVRYLNRKAGEVTVSEFFEDVALGQFRGGIQCQDVEALTFSDNTFDVCTSTEVFEHVPDDVKGFTELYRVLKPGGVLIFTVPIGGNKETVERARIVNGKIHHILSPEYHGDRIRGNAAVLCYRNYGSGIVERLASVGFRNPRIILAGDLTGWGFRRWVVVGYK